MSWYTTIVITYLKGQVVRMQPGVVSVEVHGVGYKVECPLQTWETINEATEQTIFISSYIREDRFDLFGFLSSADRSLFERLIAQSGIGPKLGLELLSVPKHIFASAISTNDAGILKNIKGIGGKTAEKLLVEIKNLAEKDPALFGEQSEQSAQLDPDTIAALESLGYDKRTITTILLNLPSDLTTTEQRVTAALQSL